MIIAHPVGKRVVVVDPGYKYLYESAGVIVENRYDEWPDNCFTPDRIMCKVAFDDSQVPFHWMEPGDMIDEDAWESFKSIHRMESDSVFITVTYKYINNYHLVDDPLAAKFASLSGWLNYIRGYELRFKESKEVSDIIKAKEKKKEDRENA